MSTIIEELAIKLGAEISDYQRNLAAASRQLNDMAQKMGAFSQKMASIGKSLTIVAGGFATGMSLMASRYNNAMNEVWSITDKNADAMNQWRTQVIKMSSDIGVSATGQAKALYQVMSAGVAASDAMQVLEASAKTAKAGFADQAQVVDALTSVMNVYSLKASEAANITDVLFTAVKLGKLNMDQLAGSIGKVLPVAKNAGVSFNEVATAMAFLTKRGLSAEMAATAFRATLLRVIAATDEQKRLAQELGFEFSLTALKTKGLVKFLDDMRAAIGQQPEAIRAVFQSEEALGAAFELAGENGREFTAMLKEINESAGATNEALRKIGSTSDDILNAALENLKNTMIAVGSALRDQWAEIYLSMKPFIDGIHELIRTNPRFFAAVNNSILVLGALTLALAAAAKAGQILFGVFTMLAAHPVVAIFLAIAAVGTALISIHNALNQEVETSIDVTNQWAEAQLKAQNAYLQASRGRIKQLREERAATDSLYAAWEKQAKVLAERTPSRIGELADSFSAIRESINKRFTEEQIFTAKLEEEYRKRESIIRDRLEWEINEAKKYRGFDEQQLEEYMARMAEKHRRLTDELKAEMEKRYREFTVLQTLETHIVSGMVSRRIKLYQDEMRARVQAAQDMANKIKSIEREILDVVKARQQWADTIEEAMNNINKVGMNDEQKWYADRNMADRYIQKAQNAAAEGDYERAEAYIHKAMNLYEGLAREVRDGNGEVVISLREGYEAAKTGLEMLDRVMQGIFTEREFKLGDQLLEAKTRLEDLKKEFEQFQQKAEKELEVKLKTDKAKDALKDLADEFHKFAKDLNLTITATVNGQKPEKHASGGWVGGPAGTDNVPAMLSRGEYVVNAQAASQFGALLERINGGGRFTSTPFNGAGNLSADVTIVVNERLTRDYIRDVLAPEIHRAISRRRA